MTAQRHVLRITHDGKTHELCMADLTVGLIKEFRAAVGLYPRAVVDRFGANEADLPELAAFIWLARRQAGEAASLADIESTLRYDTPVVLESVSEDESPEV